MSFSTRATSFISNNSCLVDELNTYGYVYYRYWIILQLNSMMMSLRQKPLIAFAFVLCAFLSDTGAAQVDLSIVPHVESINGTTYRVYANFSELANITSVFSPEAIYENQSWPGLDPLDPSDDLPANSIPPISFSTDSPNGFFHFALGPHYNTPDGIVPTLFQFYPDLEFDSWFTIGGAEGVVTGASLIPGQSSALNVFNNGGSFNTQGLVDGGGWYTATSTPFFTDTNGQILLAQLTVDSDASIAVELSLIWRDSNDESHVEIGLAGAVGVSGAGCLDLMACNYDESATESAACTYAVGICESCSGENDGTGTVVNSDADADGICDDDEIAGCIDSNACNYNVNATDSASCAYASGCDTCAGSPTNGTGYIQDNDLDNDGVCDSNEILGCTDQSACNFSITATEDNDNCVLPINCQTCSGEMDGTGSIIENDSDGDGVCDANEISGCQDDEACNFNASATDESGDCTYATGCAYCSGEQNGTGVVVDGDTDGDGICDDEEVLGCIQAEACNYNENATDADSCVYAVGCAECSGETDGTGITISNDDDADGICNMDEIMGCTNALACNYNMQATDDDGNCLLPSGCDACSGAIDGTGVVVDNDEDNDGICNADEVLGCQNPDACNYLIEATDSGTCDYPAVGYDCNGSCVLDFDGDGVCDAFEITGCTYEDACNYSQDATEDDGSCVFAEAGLDCDGLCLFDLDQDGVCDEDEVVGCSDVTACNFISMATADGYCDYPEIGLNCAGDCLADADQDGVCDADEVGGCTVYLACNYSQDATEDDGSCAFAGTGLDCDGACLFDLDQDGVCDQEEIVGCLDEDACNYVSNATENGYCDYPDIGLNCAGDCLADADQDGVCDADEVGGCTDLTADNFNANATDNNGTCNYSVSGCTYIEALNYNPQASLDDGSCQFESVECNDEEACNYDLESTSDSDCYYPSAGLDCSGGCLFDGDADGVCDADEVGGCTDNLACNYEADATDDNGACTYATTGFDCSGSCLFDIDQDGVCDQEEIVGCLDEDACNYVFNATENGYCHYPPQGLTCEGECVADVDEDGVCDADEIEGCTDYLACNFVASSTNDDGSCTYPDYGFACDGACLFDLDQDGVCDQEEVVGCSDSNACNYISNSTEDGYCEYPATGFNCGGECLADQDEDGVCDAFEILGCTDHAAINYNCNATELDDSCVFATLGCTYLDACNYQDEATLDDGTCSWTCSGCMDSQALNYDNAATTDSGECLYCEATNENGAICEGDLNDDGIRGSADLLILLSFFGMMCD